ncbi:ThuA domain-containing protein [Sphingomonas sp. 35-24ZXX]|uniref:ThuA domain-containing protein n=1 Tax=Sphingomonas sp. 35-24ZXX TaxID=1545915 RepID=UPI00068F8CE8|nr:ThuA domain-containing protein [Sphingomonas sp. 35-24ZXX]
MIRKVLKAIGIVLALAGLWLAFSVWRNWDTIQRVFLGGVKVYETTAPAMPATISRPAILVFSKTNGFRHEEAIPAAKEMFERLARENGWGIFETDNGAAFSPEILSRFDAVIFNNVSGDVFTPDQRDAFKAFVLQGGGFVGLHAAGDNSHQAWDWYVKNIIGTQFVGHPMDPQFQQARVTVEDRTHAAAQDLPSVWIRMDEWYSFDNSPRATPGVTIFATIDETTYKPGSLTGTNLAMGKDHPIAWWRCAGKGRVFYSAMGHTAESFAEPAYRRMLAGATRWALAIDGEGCRNNRGRP